MSHRIRRWGALVAASALTVSGLALATAPATAVPIHDPRPLDIAATWLEGQLTNGLIHNDQYSFDDIGLSLDAGFSLTAIGGHASTVTSIVNAVAPHISGASGYTDADEYAFTPPYALVQHGYYAGATAKALVFAEVTGQDPTTWGGTNLVTALENRVIGTGPSTGRIADDSSYGDYANTIGQAFAAHGLTAASSTKAIDAFAFLLKQQCSAGYFRLNFTADKTATDQTCNGGDPATTSAPDTDATAMAMLQIRASGVHNTAVDNAMNSAELWLLNQQRADGSFGGGPTTSASNTNSTGLAGWVLGLLGDSNAATNAAAWVRGMQADELPGCPTALSSQTGAIGYNGAAVAAGRSSGITTSSQDQWRRATAPTLPVLAYAPTATPALAITRPGAFARGGATASYTVSGVVPGDKVCVTSFGTQHPASADLDGVATVGLTFPVTTAVRTISVADRAGNTASMQTTVLGPKTLRVSAKATVAAGTRLRVTVFGLRPGEHVVLKFRGVLVRSGMASADGTFVRGFVVRRPLGRGTVVAQGQYPAIRHGSTVVTVVR